LSRLLAAFLLEGLAVVPVDQSENALWFDLHKANVIESLELE